MTTQEKTMKTIELCSDGRTKPYELYQMTVLYDYSINNVIDTFTRLTKDEGRDADWATEEAINREVYGEDCTKIDLQPFGCTAFHLKEDSSQCHLMGRNYDFRTDASAMVVRCEPKDGHKSVAFAALSNMGIPGSLSDDKYINTLVSPFVCLDGINEKGVSIAVLVVDGNKVAQTDKNKKNIFTTLAIRLVLDKAASTVEAIELLREYNMFAVGKADYHFYITDASGDSRVVEYDCNKTSREFTVTSTQAVTNFYIIYKDLVDDHNKYGHGKNRYDKVMEILDKEKGRYSDATVMKALKETAQQVGTAATSNTQWSICYNNTKRTLTAVFRQKWDKEYQFMI